LHERRERLALPSGTRGRDAFRLRLFRRVGRAIDGVLTFHFLGGERVADLFREGAAQRRPRRIFRAARPDGSLSAAPPLRLGASSMAPSSRCAAADSSTSWVLVRLFGDSFFGDIVGILCSAWSGVFRRHHRSPALARTPAGQDPGRAFGTLRCRNSDALFPAEVQSFLNYLIRLAPGLHVNGQ
jgi:hypothetical protein